MTFNTIESQASYGIGLNIGQNLKESGLEGLDAKALAAGISDVLAGNPPALEVEVLHKALNEMNQRAEAVRKQAMQKQVEAGQQFLAENAKNSDVNVTESGLQYKVLKHGEGKIPAAKDTVRVHYTGRLIDGTVFDSSEQRGQPAEFPVNGVIAGWVEALQMMPVGSRWQLYIPYELAYGERGAGGAIGPYSTLIFDVELLDILA